jgi:hypothetical protein
MPERPLLDLYFEALGQGDPALLPLAPGARYTENGQEIPFGSGAWATATGVAAERNVAVADHEQGQQAGWGMIAEAGAGALAGVRLKAGPSGLITEAEALIVRSPMFGRADFPDRLRRPGALAGPAGTEPAARATRAELRAAADAYFDGVQDDDPDLIPAADDCLRIENGVQTVLNPAAEGLGPGTPLGEGIAMGVREQVRVLGFPQIQRIRDRRYPVIDVERGLVLGLVFFDHPGPVRGGPAPARFAAPNSYFIWELFKVSGGVIRHIEAIMAMFPYGMRPGW